MRMRDFVEDKLDEGFNLKNAAKKMNAAFRELKIMLASKDLDELEERIGQKLDIIGEKWDKIEDEIDKFFKDRGLQ